MCYIEDNIIEDFLEFNFNFTCFRYIINIYVFLKC